MQTCMSKNVVNCNSVTVELPMCRLFNDIICSLSDNTSVKTTVNSKLLSEFKVCVSPVS